MRRLLPTSLVSQLAILIGIALFVAQLVNFGLILNERDKASLAQNQGPAITRFVSVASDYAQAPPEFRLAVLEDASRRGAAYRAAPESVIAPDVERQSTVEARVSSALREAGLNPLEVRASTRLVQQRRAGATREAQVLILSARLPHLGWLSGQLVTPRADPWLRVRLAVATLLLFIIVLGATLIAVNRLVWPLRQLTRAAERFGGRDTPEPVRPAGPADIRQAIEAFNAMNRRVAALLDEKDRMLGAIGHDLRTPLASLRIRAESVEPEAERRRMIATVDEMAAMLDDILVLARSGRAREEARPVDVAALADAVVEEARDIGQNVSFEQGESCVAPVQPVLLRRALRNLIDNAVKYGGSARVSVKRVADELSIEVADNGPGLPDAELQQVFEPFYRVESSRSKVTGGIGLGLPIVRSIAESHGGGLKLRNSTTGLVASITLPVC